MIVLHKTLRFAVYNIDLVVESERRKKSKYLSDQLVVATEGKQYFDLHSSEVLNVLEPHLEKCRNARTNALEEYDKLGLPSLQAHLRMLGSFTVEEIVIFDTKKYPIRQAFCTAIFDKENIDLPNLHKLANNDQGKRKQRDEKLYLLSPLLDDKKRAYFQQAYENLILNVILPNAHSSLPDKSKRNEIFYQAFPCVRCVRPGEFSIGCHADCNYGFQAGNVNYYLPLMEIRGSNSLAIETEPALEDWHFLELQYGEIHRFWGSTCSHFTVENTSPSTRISFDFRVIPAITFHKHKIDRFSSEPGYYVKAVWNEEHKCWERAEDLARPDWRVGFPFVK